MPRTSEITVTQRASTKLMKISQNFHENFTKISFENSLVPDEMYAFPYQQRRSTPPREAVIGLQNAALNGPSHSIALILPIAIAGGG